jgi:hypothetical protein
MCLVAKGVSRLLGQGPVVAQPIRFDYQPEVGPVEVRLEAIQVVPCHWQWQTSSAGKRQEAAVEL